MPTWDHNGWRRETTDAAKRDELILHIEEVEQKLAGYSFIGGMGGHQARKFELESYQKRMENHLTKLEAKMGIGEDADWNPWVQARASR